MRCSVSDVVAAAAVTVMIAIAALGFTAGCDGSHPGEVARLRAHFAAVDGELRAADVSQLSPAQRAARAAAIERLRGYAARGVFPHNHDRAERTPVFVDRHGTRCAMAYLIEEADGADLVAKVHATQNLAYIPQIAADAALEPDLVAWLDRNGLTAAEAARIQPSYDGCGFNDCTNTVDRRFAVASLGLAVVDGMAIGANLRPDAGNSAAGVGLVAGGLTFLVGWKVSHDSDEQKDLQRDLGWVDVGIGAITAAVSIRTLARGRSSKPSGGWSLAPNVGATRGVTLRTSF